MHVHRMKLVLSALVALALLFNLSNTTGRFEKPRVLSAFDSLLIRYDAYVDEFLAESNAPGAAIAIVKDDRIVYIRGFGSRKIGEDEPVDTNTAFRLASLSKGFASVLTALLVKDSVLSWDDKVVTYLPTFSLKDRAATQRLTIRNLLNHTTGLVPNAFDNLVEANTSFDVLTKRLKEAPSVCRVGECYSYQNVAFSLIGPVIESATGRTYEDLVRERILEPLGMHTASVGKEGLTETGNFAYPHVRRNRRWLSTAVKDRYYNVEPAAGVNASIFDMAQWLRAMMGGMPNVVPPEVVATVSAPQVRTPDEAYRFNKSKRYRSAQYGLGWRILDYEGNRLVFHSGGVQGYSSHIAFLPEKSIGIVVLQNSSNDYSFVYDFFDLYLGIS